MGRARPAWRRPRRTSRLDSRSFRRLTRSSRRQRTRLSRRSRRVATASPRLSSRARSPPRRRTKPRRSFKKPLSRGRDPFVLFFLFRAQFKWCARLYEEVFIVFLGSLISVKSGVVLL